MQVFGAAISSARVSLDGQCFSFFFFFFFSFSFLATTVNHEITPGVFVGLSRKT